MSGIHPTAVIDPTARLGAGVAVGAYTVVGAEVVLGEGTVLGPHVVIHAHTTLGARCRVHAHAVIGDTPQDLAFKPETVSYVRIGDDVVLREGVTIHRGTREGTATEVGSNCYLMANVHLAHNVRVGNRVIIANGTVLGGYAEVGDGAFLSALAGAHQFARIGRLAMLAAGSIATSDLPPFCTTHTSSCNVLVGINTVGLRRSGMAAADRLAIRKAFHILFRSGLGRRVAVEKVRALFSEGPARELADFVASSKRGVCKVRRAAGAAPEPEEGGAG